MIRTKQVIIFIACVLAVLIGLLIAVRVFAPEEMEYVPLPAAVFSATSEEYPVFVFNSPRTDGAESMKERLQRGEGNSFDVQEAYLAPPEREPEPESPAATAIEPIFVPEPQATTTLEVLESFVEGGASTTLSE